MVYMKGHKKSWTWREQRKLFELWKTESDWSSRSSKMAQTFSGDRGKGFFTANSCQSEFDRLMSSPCPGHAPSVGVGQHAGYSHKTVIDSWIAHLDKEIADDDRRAAELSLVEIRNKTAQFERLWSGTRPLDGDEVAEALRQARKEDAKRPDQVQVHLVVNAYMNRIKEVMLEKNEQTPSSNKSKDAADATLLPPSKRSLESPRGADSAFRSPSPSSHSPMKSPIRAVAESIREVMSPLARPPAVVEKVEEEEDEEGEEETMDTRETSSVDEDDQSAAGIDESTVDDDRSSQADSSVVMQTEEEEEEARGDTRMDTPLTSVPGMTSPPRTPSAAPAVSSGAKTPAASSPVKKETVATTPAVATPKPVSVVVVEEVKKRGRGRPPTKHVAPPPPVIPSPAPQQPKEEPESIDERESVSIGERSDARRKISKTDESIHVEDSPAGRRGSRRGVIDSPIVSSGRGKRAKTATEEVATPTTGGKTRRVEIKESSVISDTTPSSFAEQSLPPAPSSTEPISIQIQTEISIQGPLWVHVEKRERRQSLSRKSARRSDASEDTTSPHRDVGIQTGRVDFDKQDQVFVTWTTSDREFVRTVAVDSDKTKEEEWSDDDDMSLSRLAAAKQRSVSRVDEDKGGVASSSTALSSLADSSKRELTVTYDTDEWLARAISAQFGFESTESSMSSPSKRARKEERLRDDQTVHTKTLLNNTLRAMASHKHSGIFAHPVPDKVVPEYAPTVKRRMDLQSLKREVEMGVVTTPAQLRYKLQLMFANAVMFNGSIHEVNKSAQEMYQDTAHELMKITQDERRAASMSHPRRSKIHDEAPRSSSAHPSFSRRPRHFPEMREGKTRAIYRKAANQRLARAELY